ncbi:MAG TPA: hypothetical protein VM901_00355 [Bdellovibrionota bacterium]|nr:hypothetical protein [Bdellovibrionota bacterium]
MKYWIFSAVTTMAFAANSEARVLDAVRAVVQDRPILNSDVTMRVQAVKASASLASILGVSAASFDEDKALQSLIEEKIVLVSAKEHGAEPSEAEVGKQVGVIASQNHISVEKLKQSLQAEKIDFDLYKENISVQLAKRAIIEKELRSSSAGQNDQELKNYYEKNLSDEYDLAAIRKPNNPSSRNVLSVVRSRILKQPSRMAEQLKTHKASDLGWNDPSSLNEAFQKALQGVGPNSLVTAPFVWNNAAYLLVIKGRRKGSAENFDGAKEQIRQQIQAKDVEERFQSWIEQKKKTMNIVVNNT